MNDGSAAGCDRNRIYFLLAVAISLCLVCYTAARACLLSFVHDEGVTYLMFVMMGPKALFDCYSANNHFLNTFLMYAASKVFGAGEFALRLPNVMAHIAYIAASYFLVRRYLKNAFLAVCAFLVLNMNPLVLDFFSLARGYGLAMAFMMWSLCFFLRALGKEWPDQRSLLSSFWCAGLAVFANIAFLNYMLSLVLAYIVIDACVLVKGKDGEAYAGNFYRIMVKLLARTKFFYKHLILMLLVILPLAINFKFSGTLYYGGQGGFWADTVGSLLAGSNYGQAYLPVFIALSAVLIVLVAVAAVYLLALQLTGRTNHDFVALGVVFIVTVCTAGLTVLQHYLLGTPYPMDRTAIFFIVLFSVMAVLLAAGLVSMERRIARAGSAFVLAVWAIGMSCHTIGSANLDHTFVWKYCADVKQMIVDVGADLDRHGGQRKIELGINWLFEPSINYYYAVREPSWLQIVTRDGIAGDYDYYYVRPEDRAQLLAKDVEMLKEYPVTGNILARRKK